MAAPKANEVDRTGTQYPSVTRLDSLDLLRGLCALAVGIFHLCSWTEADVPEALEGFLAVCGTYGVSVFFVLSGYSLAHGYGARFEDAIGHDTLRRYARRRIGRLMPLFGIVVVASVAGRMVTGGEIPDLLTIAANILLIFGFFDPSLTPVIGGWSIGIEVVFYVLFPILLILRQYAVGVILGTVLLTAWISLAVLDQGGLAAGWAEYVSPANHLIFFAAGVYAGYHLRTQPQWEGYGAIAITVAILALILLASLWATELSAAAGVRRWLLVPLSIALVIAMSRIKVSRMTMVASLAGAASYPLYLIHPLVFLMGIRVLPAGVLSSIFMLVVALVLALLVDLLIDKPLQRRLKAAGW